MPTRDLATLLEYLLRSMNRAPNTGATKIITSMDTAQDLVILKPTTNETEIQTHTNIDMYWRVDPLSATYHGQYGRERYVDDEELVLLGVVDGGPVPARSHGISPEDLSWNTYDSTVTAQSPRGYWKLDDHLGTTIKDSSGNSHDGTATSVTLADIDGPLRTSHSHGAKFNGTTSTVSVPHHADFNLTGDSTIEAWVRVRDYKGTIISKGTAWALKQLSTGKLRSEVTVSGVTYTLDSNRTIEIDRWHHVQVVRKGDTLSFIIDDNDDAATYVTGTLDTNTTAIAIGSGYDGHLSSIAVYPTAPSTRVRGERVRAGFLYPWLKVWLDARDIWDVTNASPVSTWWDHSTWGLSPTQSGAARPTLTSATPAVTFDGADSMARVYNTTYDTVDALTVFAVVKPTTLSGTHTILARDDGTTRLWRLYLTSTGVITIATGAATTLAGGSVAANTKAILSFTWNSSGTVELFKDGVSLGTAAFGALPQSTSLGFSIGALGNDTNFFIGDMMELSIITKALSLSHHATVVQYLKNKWAI